MVPSSDIRGFHHFPPPESPILGIPHNFGLFQHPSDHHIHNIPNQIQSLNTFLSNLPNCYNFPNSSGNSAAAASCCNSTSDEADELQVSIIDERKQRRMISNRESARRSRMRKQKHLDELWSQVVRLRNENHTLIDKLNHVSESHDRVLQENARLKEEASDLRQMLADLKIGSSSSFADSLRDFVDHDDDLFQSWVLKLINLNGGCLTIFPLFRKKKTY